MEAIEIILVLASVISVLTVFIAWLVKKIIKLTHMVSAGLQDSTHATDNNTAALKEIRKVFRDPVMRKLKKATR